MTAGTTGLDTRTPPQGAAAFRRAELGQSELR